jgi:hypothetical protein
VASARVERTGSEHDSTGVPAGTVSSTSSLKVSQSLGPDRLSVASTSPSRRTKSWSTISALGGVGRRPGDDHLRAEASQGSQHVVHQPVGSASLDGGQIGAVNTQLCCELGL